MYSKGKHREKIERDTRVTPEFGRYLEKNLYPQIQGVTDLSPLKRISPSRFRVG
jgi:hypothetical protein